MLPSSSSAEVLLLYLTVYVVAANLVLVHYCPCKRGLATPNVALSMSLLHLLF